MTQDGQTHRSATTWHEFSVETACQDDEARVANTLWTVVGCLILVAAGLCGFGLAAGGYIHPAPVDLVATLLGGCAISFGLLKIGRILGQQAVVRRWRAALEDQEPDVDIPPWMLAEADQHIAHINTVLTAHVASAAALVAAQGKEDAVVQTHAKLRGHEPDTVALLAAGALVRLVEHEQPGGLHG